MLRTIRISINKFTFTGGEPTLLYDLVAEPGRRSGHQPHYASNGEGTHETAPSGDHMGRTNFAKVWGIRADYVTPRDQVPWLKIQHRNLWVAASGGFQDTTCRVQGCRAEENQEHLVLCPGIQRDFWVSVAILINEPPEHGWMQVTLVKNGCSTSKRMALQPGLARGSGDHLLGVEMSLRGSGRS